MQTVVRATVESHNVRLRIGGILPPRERQPPKVPRAVPVRPKPPREAAVARDIGGLPTVAGGLENMLVPSLARPELLE